VVGAVAESTASLRVGLFVAAGVALLGSGAAMMALRQTAAAVKFPPEPGDGKIGAA
jgi:hypothetical protein